MKKSVNKFPDALYRYHDKARGYYVSAQLLVQVDKLFGHGTLLSAYTLFLLAIELELKGFVIQCRRELRTSRKLQEHGPGKLFNLIENEDVKNRMSDKFGTLYGMNLEQILDHYNEAYIDFRYSDSIWKYNKPPTAETLEKIGEFILSIGDWVYNHPGYIEYS